MDPMGMIVGVRERVFEVRDVVTPFEHVPPSDGSWLIMGLTAVPKQVPPGSKVEIVVGENTYGEYSLGELMDRYKRAAGDGVTALATVLQGQLESIWEELILAMRAEHRENADRLHDLYRSTMEELADAATKLASAHVLQLLRPICVPPRQRIRIDAVHPLGIVDAVTVRLFMLASRTIA
jgi:hypothetical protein